MKNSKLLILLLLAISIVGCEKDFLEEPPKDQMTDETYWTSESAVETFAYAFYPAYFVGYSSGWGWGSFYRRHLDVMDDFANSAPLQFTKNVPASGGGWSFAWVRKANIFIDRVQGVPMEEEAINHWTGIGRFFRGLEYHDLVNRFGDVPWIEEELSETDVDALYKPRDPRTFVMDKVLEDFQFAAANVRTEVGTEGLEVDRNVVLGFMSRVFLFEGTWQKYHGNNPQKAAEYLEAAKWAANEVINSGDYSLGDYRDVFSSLDLSANPEVILYREYESGNLTHTLVSYNNKEPQIGSPKDAIDNYLASDGLPISLSPLYQGDHGIENVMANRDPRLHETIVPYELRIPGVFSNRSTTGFSSHKFLNEEIKDLPEGSSLLNPTDAPVLRYGEVLINYAEAAAELATVGGPALSQTDLDKSINVLRSRPGINLPPLQVMGNEPAVNGVIYDDPTRDQDVPSMIWEIRRERRTELMYEGFRWDDLRRWKKLEYTTTTDGTNDATQINLGAWIDKSLYPDNDLSALQLADENGVFLPATATQGYIVPAPAPGSQRIFEDPKVYLFPIPLNQITLYAENGVDLQQNPGWN